MGKLEARNALRSCHLGDGQPGNSVVCLGGLGPAMLTPRLSRLTAKSLYKSRFIEAIYTNKFIRAIYPKRHELHLEFPLTRHRTSGKKRFHSEATV